MSHLLNGLSRACLKGVVKIEEGGWKFLVNYDRLSMHKAGTWEQGRGWSWRRGKVKVMGCRMRMTREAAGGDGGRRVRAKGWSLGES